MTWRKSLYIARIPIPKMFTFVSKQFPQFEPNKIRHLQMLWIQPSGDMSLWHLSKTAPLRVQYGISKIMYCILCKTEGSNVTCNAY